MTRRVTVIVEGREYHVEVEDLAARPIRASVNQKTYHVYLRSRKGEAFSDVRPVERTRRSQEAQPAGGAPMPPPAAAPQPADQAAVTAPMPGDIAEIRVRVGDEVQPGDVVCVLEAMKMKNLIHTARAGVVASINVEVGQSVDYGAVLVALQ